MKRSGTCTLTANAWQGDLPVPGQYLMSLRGRTAFLIVEVKPAPATARYRCKLVCERERRDRVAPNAVVHRWEWAKR